MGIRSHMSWSEKGHNDSSFSNDHQGDFRYFRMHVHDMVILKLCVLMGVRSRNYGNQQIFAYNCFRDYVTLVMAAILDFDK